MSHTPGPWRAQKLNSGSVAGTIPVTTEDYGKSITNPGALICSVCGTSKTQADTARLIAAAPEMYEALVDLLGFLFHRKKDRQAILRAKAALAKARGDEGEGEGFDEAEYRRLLEAQKANKLSPQEEERLVQLYEEGEVDDIPSVFLRPEVEQKMDSLIEKIGKLIQGLKARGEEGEENA